MREGTKFRTINIHIPSEEKKVPVGKNGKFKIIHTKEIKLKGTLASIITEQDDNTINFALAVSMCSKKDNYKFPIGSKIAGTRLHTTKECDWKFNSVVGRPSGPDDPNTAFRQMRDKIADHLTNVIYNENNTPTYIIKPEHVH